MRLYICTYVLEITSPNTNICAIDYGFSRITKIILVCCVVDQRSGQHVPPEFCEYDVLITLGKYIWTYSSIIRLVLLLSWTR